MNNEQKKRTVFRFTIIIGFLMTVLCSGCGGSSNSGEVYSVSGTISGLKSGETLVLKNHLGEELTLSANGEFRFQGKLPNHSSYNHLIARQPSCQSCSVAKSSGTINGGDITDVAVTCGYSLGGMVYGLAPGGSLSLSINATPCLVINSNGPFTFPSTLNDGDSYTVGVAIQPQNQTASVFLPSGTISGNNVSNITVQCLNNQARYVYTANMGSSNISISSVDQNTGQITSLATVPTGNYPAAVAVDPSNRYVYTANEHDNSVSAFTINPSTGLLTAVAGSPFSVDVPAGTNPSPYSLATDPFGRFVYASNCTANNISGFTVNQTTGVLTLVAEGPFASGGSPNSIIIDPTGKFLYSANFADSGSIGGNTISAYTINQTTGALTEISGSPYAASGPQSLSIDPLGKFLYIANQNNNTVGAYSINKTTGALTSVPHQGFAAGTRPRSVAVHPIMNYVYAANNGSNNISAYTYNSSGVLAAITGSPFNIGQPPTSIAIDPTGQFLHVTCQTGKVYSFLVDMSTGMLTQPHTGASQTTGSSPMSVASAMAGAFANYTSDNGYYSTLYANTLNITNGAIRRVQAVSLPGEGNKCSIDIDPTGRFLHISDYSAYAYSVNPATGNLSAVQGSPFSMKLDGYVAIHPSGRFSYVAGAWSVAVPDDISVFSIDPVTGALTSLGVSMPTGHIASGFTIEPYGRWAYLIDSGSNQITAFSIDQTTGALTENIPGSPFTGFHAPQSIAFDPYGRFMFLIEAGIQSVSVLLIDQFTGELSAISGSPFTAISNASSITIHPTGRYAYVASYSMYDDNDTLQVYDINQTSWELTPISGEMHLTDKRTNSVTIDPTGKYLCAVNGGDGYDGSSISVFLINPINGTLQEVPGSPFSTDYSISGTRFVYTVR